MRTHTYCCMGSGEENDSRKRFMMTLLSSDEMDWVQGSLFVSMSYGKIPDTSLAAALNGLASANSLLHCLLNRFTGSDRENAR
jgi:hypothetical protein